MAIGSDHVIEPFGAATVLGAFVEAAFASAFA